MNKPTLLIAGGTGLIGKEFINQFHERYNITILSRKKKKKIVNKAKFITWEDFTKNPNIINKTNFVLNLCGEPIINFWTKSTQKKIVSSRLDTTKVIANVINQAQTKPKCLINASAIGFYGNHTKKTCFNENDEPGKDFLATLCKDWEEQSQKANCRVVSLRIGLVLSNNKGFFNILKKIFSFYIGGHLGNGTQATPWIHIHDLINSIDFIFHTQSIKGPVNGVAPNKINLKTFCQIIGKITKKPSWLHVPEVVIKFFLRGLGEHILYTPYVEPGILNTNNFKFIYKEPIKAIENLLKK